MLKFFVRRLLRSILTLLLVVTAVFIALRVTGDPAQAMLPDDATPEQMEAFRERFGLDHSIPVQYARYIQQLAQGEFGESLRERRPATDLLRSRIRPTLELATAALVIGLAVGIPAGVLAAVKHNQVWDRVLMGGAFLGQSAPNFFIGIILILVFALELKLLPSSGRGGWQNLILPALTLSTGLLAGTARMTRSSMLEVIRQDYVRTARAKGLPERALLIRHCLRNAAIPVITLIGLQVSVMIGGAAIVETVFAWPGVGRLAVNAIAIRDYPVIQLIVIMVAASVVVVNLGVDLIYALLDPRIRQA
ncbi:MAG: ABC transporter permease [Dehalococcoidia bacterium]